MYGAARGLTDVLDPHSRFMDPEEYERLQQGDRGRRGDHRHRHRPREAQARLVVVSPIEGSPAARAGIEPGDVIRDRRHRRRARWNGTTPSTRIQGPAGSEVVLVIERRGRELTFRIRREQFEVKTVEGRLLDDGYGYVKIRIFSSNTDAKLLEALEEHQDARPRDGRHQGPDPGPAAQPGRPARSGGEGGRSLPRPRG